MWEESDTKVGDKPDSVLAFRSSTREHSIGHKFNTVVECLEEEEEEEAEENSSDEEYLRYNTSFASSFAELAYTQSGPVDSVINSFLVSEGQTHSVSSKQQFNVLVHAQTTSELPKENGPEPSSFVVERVVKNVSESDSLSTVTNSYDILSPSTPPSSRSDIPATVSSADVISASKSVTTYTSESEYIERTTEASSATTLVSTSQQEKGEADKEVHLSDLHIEEAECLSHENQGEEDVLVEVDSKLNSPFSSQSSLASNPSPRSTSLSRYERLSGSEPDSLISKEPGATRVHSERPGGWEGVSHELVYPLTPEQWRRESRRRKWQKKASSKDEVESVSFVISVDRKSSEPTREPFRTTYQHRTVTVPDQELPYFKPTSGNVQTITFESSPDIYGTYEILKKMNEKQALVDRSECFEETTKPDKINKDNFTPLNFQINPAYPVYAQKSPDEHDTVMSVDYTKGVGRSDDDQGSGKENDSKTSRWDGRINPFNNEEPSEADEVFTKGIIDLDDSSENEADGTKANTRDSDDNEPGTIPSRKSLSDAEEQINLKTQFKDAYYNIGSTEDLLKELAADDERDGDLGVPSKPRLVESRTDSSGGTSEVEEKDITEGDQEQDRDPLIEDANKENKENEKMPFGFLKKKETAEVQASKPEAEAADGKTTKTGDVIENGDTAKESTTAAADASKGSVEKTDKDGNAAVTFTKEGADGAEVKAEVQQPTKTGTKTEKSPLIEADAIETPEEGKESKVRDHSPGFLCCTIL